MTSHLYLLVFPQRGMLKVGKADDVHERIQSLRRHWGEVDYEASYQLAAPTDVVFRLEKSMHFLLSEHALRFDTGDGKTELFGCRALERALQHIELFAPGQITKGIARPVVQRAGVAAGRRPQSVDGIFYRKTRAASKAMVASAERAAAQFDRINRWLLVLLRRRQRIQYQYSTVDGVVRFRLRGAAAQRLQDFDQVDLFFFVIQDLNRYAGYNLASGCSRGDIVQINVRLPTSLESDGYHASAKLLAYFSAQTERLLARLPQRSEAATEEIPELDPAEILDSLLTGMQREYERDPDACLQGGSAQPSSEPERGREPKPGEAPPRPTSS